MEGFQSSQVLQDFLCEIYDLCLRCMFFWVAWCMSSNKNNMNKIQPQSTVQVPGASNFLVRSTICCMPVVNDRMHPASPCSKMVGPHARRLWRIDRANDNMAKTLWQRRVWNLKCLQKSSKFPITKLILEKLHKFWEHGTMLVLIIWFNFISPKEFLFPFRKL